MKKAILFAMVGGIDGKWQGPGWRHMSGSYTPLLGRKQSRRVLQLDQDWENLARKEV